MKQRWGARAALLGVCLVFLLPVLWLLSTSYKSSGDIFGLPPRLLFTPTLANFRGLFQFFDVPQLTLNTLIIGIGAALSSLLLGTPCGYALARLDTPWSRLAAYVFLAVRMVPPVAVLIPFYMMMRDAGLLGTWWAVILIDTAQSSCFVIWMMYGYFKALPKEMEEAAQMDGCSTWNCFWRVALPVVRPGLVASGLFALIFAWNSFMFSAYLTNSQTRPLAVAMISAFGSNDITWGTMGALAHFSILPIVVLTLWLNKYFVSGLTRGIH
ncbi:MAG TPA: carbohydrate ABC transporter permease [Burkholderiaceae bacterium]|nr:carbohydrate ABC transporter permease [Burkholderiaceae bacterium]